ncbi:protein-tyrosine phosphatase-like protein, partial [Obelidium mucronatum]
PKTPKRTRNILSKEENQIETSAKCKQLFELGFEDNALNQLALEATVNGTLDEAIDYLLLNINNPVLDKQSLEHVPLFVSWLFASHRLPHPDSIVPVDSLDTLGLSSVFYPSGRAPSTSAFVGKHKVAKPMEKAQLKLWTSSKTRPFNPCQKSVSISHSAFVVIPSLILTGLQYEGMGVMDDGDSGNAYGNIAMSSCPGEKERDLDFDFAHFASLKIKAVVCCLRDVTLDTLCAAFDEYQEVASKYGIEVLRIPMRSGDCPKNIKAVTAVIEQMDQVLRNGGNVLIHCKAGIGRAGVVASCFLLRKHFVTTAERAIQFVRIRRVKKQLHFKPPRFFPLLNTVFSSLSPF